MNKKKLWISFFVPWILANLAGWFSYSAILITPHLAWKIPLSAAAVLGLLQWAVLNHHLGIDFRWMAASMLVYGSLFYAEYAISYSGSLLFLAAILLGLLGLMHYWILDEQIAHAKAWIFTSPIAGVLGLLFAALALQSGSLGRAWATQGLVYGIVTGIVLMFSMSKLADAMNSIHKKGG